MTGPPTQTTPQAGEASASITESDIAYASHTHAPTAKPSAHPMMEGYVMILGAVVCNGARYYSDKAALNLGCTPLMLVMISCLITAVGFFVLGVVWRVVGWKAATLHETTVPSVMNILRRYGWMLTIAAAAATTAGFFYAKALHLYGPETTAFLNNMAIVFMVIAGLLGGERLRLAETLSILVLLSGAFLFSYKGNQIQWGALAIMALVCFMNTNKQLLTKRTIGRSSVVGALTGIQIITVPMAGIPAYFSNQLVLPSPTAIGCLAFSAIVGTMAGMSLLYGGYQRIGVARGAPIDSMRPRAALLIGLALGIPFPGLYQCIGGALVLIGSFALARAMRKHPAPTSPMR